MDIFKTLPQDLINRYLAISEMRTHYSPEQIKGINPDFTVDMFNEENEAIIDIDYEYAFFGAETAQVQFLMQKLHESKTSESKELLKADMEIKLQEIQKNDEIFKNIMNKNPLL